mmetsp:Transcript_36153/g.84097  ORF Transcript_36153/g.84097 Transcript_36153/m.84097 type:complete len:215 (+) Transcript_36153:1955-2599(+)
MLGEGTVALEASSHSSAVPRALRFCTFSSSSSSSSSFSAVARSVHQPGVRLSPAPLPGHQVSQVQFPAASAAPGTRPHSCWTVPLRNWCAPPPPGHRCSRCHCVRPWPSLPPPLAAKRSACWRRKHRAPCPESWPSPPIRHQYPACWPNHLAECSVRWFPPARPKDFACKQSERISTPRASSARTLEHTAVEVCSAIGCQDCSQSMPFPSGTRP